MGVDVATAVAVTVFALLLVATVAGAVVGLDATDDCGEKEEVRGIQGD